jgi:PKD repeat protein
MSSKAQSFIMCAVMLMSTLVMGFPVMDSSHEMISSLGIKQEEPQSGPTGLSSSYLASIVIGADNDLYDGQGMGRFYNSFSNFYSWIDPHWQFAQSTSDYEIRPWAVYDLSDLAQYNDITISSGQIRYWKISRKNVIEIDVWTIESIPYEILVPSSTAQDWFNEIGGNGSVKIASESYTGSTDYVREDRWITISPDGITALNNRLDAGNYEFPMGADVTSLFNETTGYMGWGDVRLELNFSYNGMPCEAQGEIAVGNEQVDHGNSSVHNNYFNYVHLVSPYRGYATWDANLFKNLIPTSGLKGEDIILTGIYLRMNIDHHYGIPNPTIRQMDNDPRYTPWSTTFLDAGDGTIYYTDTNSVSPPEELEWDLGPDALEDFNATLDGSPNFFAVGFTSTGVARLLSIKLVIKWEVGNPPQLTLRLGADNPEHPGQAHGISRLMGINAYCTSHHISCLEKSKGLENRGWVTFDLKDVEAWDGVTVKSANLIIHNYFRSYVKEVKFTALETTPYNSSLSTTAMKVYTESGPSGTEIGSVSFTSKGNTGFHSYKVPLNSTAVNAINTKLKSSAIYKTFGVGSYISSIHSGNTYHYLRMTDVRLEISFEYDKELQSTEGGEGVAFGDDISGETSNFLSIYNLPQGFAYCSKTSSYEWRGYFQWNIQSILSAFEQVNISNIQFTKVSLRFNHLYTSLSGISIYHLIYNMSDTSISNIDKFTDCSNGTLYYSSGSVGSSFDEYEWDLGSEAVIDIQNAFSDDSLDYFGLGITTTSTSGYSLDYGPRLVLEWGSNLNQPPVAGAGLNQTVDEGDTVLLNGSASNSPSSSIVKYEWDFESDGTYDYQETASSALDGSFDGKTMHTYGDNGVFTVTLRVTDDKGANGTDTCTITVLNVAPIITPFGPFSFDEGMNFDLSVMSTDLGSDDLTFTWEMEMGPTVTKVYYNDGTGPDPYPSPGGTFQFLVTDLVSHMYGDDGVYSVDLTVEDDDGGVSTYSTTVSMGNTAPEIQRVEAYVLIDYTLRAAGEKWHNVQMYIAADGEDIAFAEVIRYPGSPDDQSVTLEDIKCEVTKVIEVKVLYTPLDDPINGQQNGATPCWVNISFYDGGYNLTHHTFNVNHPDTWDWIIGVNRMLVDHEITFESEAADLGSDDLTFSWEWSDGSPCTETLFCNDGTNPEPVYDSGINEIRTPWGNCPFSTSGGKAHTFTKGGNYPVTLTVTDDDGGLIDLVINVILS